ncbi:MAG: histone deacetylase [Sedimentisphaerales bacterium]|nr:histone deacetylase [Sedimentisphaerales bacterium]
MTTLLGYDERFLQHRTGKHVERPARLTSIVERLKHEGIWDDLKPVTGDVDPAAWIKEIHSQEYIDRLESACRNELPFIDTADSAICPDSFEVAHLAVANVLAAADMIVAKEAENGFCALRPPGHHAEHDRSMGFCLFNNVAIVSRYLQKRHNFSRILILDWDVHHGNGTQHSFEEDPTVFYCSLHEHPATCFPGTGWPNEFGKGAGRGATLNLPMAPGAGDDECLDLFETNFYPVAREFRPDFVLISAGFDAHRKDPLAELELTEHSFKVMTKRMMELARQCCGGRLLSLLEGGYQLGSLSSSVSTHIRALMEQ